MIMGSCICQRMTRGLNAPAGIYRRVRQGGQDNRPVLPIYWPSAAAAAADTEEMTYYFRSFSRRFLGSGGPGFRSLGGKV